MTLPETAETGAAASPNAPAAQPRLTGRLGVVGIVFMVVAAAAPLTVIAGNMPIAIGGPRRRRAGRIHHRRSSCCCSRWALSR